MKLRAAFVANCFFAFMLFSAVPKAFGISDEKPVRSPSVTAERSPDHQPNMEPQRIGLAIHGGAGTIERSKITPEREREFRAGLERALSAGYEILKRGGSSLDATEAAVRTLEDDPHFRSEERRVGKECGFWLWAGAEERRRVS